MQVWNIMVLGMVLQFAVSVIKLNMMNNQKTLYSSITVANHFISLAKEEDRTLSSFYLLKLVYLSHCWHLGIHGYGLISDFIVARKYGPVIESLYNAMLSNRNKSSGGFIGSDDLMRKVTDKDDFMKSIWNRYKHLEDWELASISHDEDSPWNEAINANGVDSIIPDKIIRDHYAKLVSNLKSKNL